MQPVVEAALISAVAALVGVGGTTVVAVIGARNSRLANQATTAALQADQATRREEQFARRFGLAIEQLGADQVDVRVGAIYSLERLEQAAMESPEGTYPPVLEVLASFIREHSQEQWPPPFRYGDESSADPPDRKTRPDVQAAVTVIGRRNPESHHHIFNLSAADLTRADLSRAHFNGANLSGANLSHANLTDADLTDADLTKADLTEARLSGAIFDRADLTGARWPPEAALPEGWERETRRGAPSRLRRIAPASGNGA